MNLPFSIEQFYGVFRAYNQTVWPAQIVLVVLAVITIVMMLRRRASSDRIASGLLAFLWIWLGLAYHLAFFSSINPAAYGFAALSVVGGLVFLWQGVVRSRIQFRRLGGWRPLLGGALVVYALVLYPLWLWAAGHAYMATPTFGLPCPTTLFTIGVLAFAYPTSPRSVYLVPVLWCVVGVQAAFLLGVTQDLGLALAGVVGLVLIVRSRGTIATTEPSHDPH